MHRTNLSELSDEELVRCVGKDYDEAVYNELYRRFSPRVWCFLLSHLNNRNDAEDCSQHVWLNVWAKLTEFKSFGPRSFINWAFRIAYNKSLDIRKVRKRGPISATDVNGPQTDGNEPQDSASEERLDAERDQLTEVDRKIAEENWQAIHDCIAKLPDGVREVAYLRYCEGASTGEVAEILNILLGTVLSRSSKARQLLTPCLIRRGLSFDDRAERALPPSDSEQ